MGTAPTSRRKERHDAPPNFLHRSDDPSGDLDRLGPFEGSAQGRAGFEQRDFIPRFHWLLVDTRTRVPSDRASRESVRFLGDADRHRSSGQSFRPKIPAGQNQTRLQPLWPRAQAVEPPRAHTSGDNTERAQEFGALDRARQTRRAQ